MTSRTPSIKLKKRSKRRLVRTGLIFGNIVLLILVATFILTNKSASQTVRRNSVSTAIQTVSQATDNPLDQLSSAEIAAQVAVMAALPEGTAVKNQADSENAQLSIVPSDSSIIAKPQIVSTAQKTKKSIVRYTSVQGDTVTALAAKYGVNANSIKWSNGLTGDGIPAGKQLVIPPANGIVYQVKTGDTIDSVVGRYQADKTTFIAVNDAESGRLAVGDYVFMPNVQQPAPVTRYSVSRYSGFAWGGSAPVYSANGYDYGYCTWYAANKRAAIGRPIPSNLGNASTWKVLAQRAGLATGPTPKVGAVAWKVPNDYYGHVAFVESVNADGSFVISEMNVAGWARVSSQTVSAGAVGSYYFIY